MSKELLKYRKKRKEEKQHSYLMKEMHALFREKWSLKFTFYLFWGRAFALHYFNYYAKIHTKQV